MIEYLDISNQVTLCWLPALIMGGAGLLGNIFGGLFGSSSANSQSKKNFQYAKDLARYQADLQREQFDYTNWYNHPYNQVERLKQAGLNPNLAYGSGSVVGSTASMPSVSAPHMNQSDPMALAQYQLQFAQMFKDLAATGAQIAKTRAEKKNIEADTEGKKISNQTASETQPFEIKMREHMSRERGWLADIAESNALKARYDVINARDLHNATQLVIRGLDGDFFFDYMKEGQKDGYLRDLQESELYNSIKAIYQRDALGVKELRKKISILNGEIERLPFLARKYESDAVVSEFRANLAKAGINPDDPVWARLIVTILGPERIQKIVDKVGGFIGKVGDWIFGD